MFTIVCSVFTFYNLRSKSNSIIEIFYGLEIKDRAFLCRSGANRKPAGPIDVIQIETFHYADKEKSEACIIEQLLWLNHLIKQTKVDANGGERRMPMRSPSHKTLGTKDQNPVPLATSAPSPKRTLQTKEQNPVPLASSALSTKASTEDEEKLQDVSNESGHKE